MIPMAIFGFAGLSGRVIVDIPFDFTVGNKELKAGRYAVSRITPSGPNGTLLIRNEENHAAANFNVNGVTGKEDADARLVSTATAIKISFPRILTDRAKKDISS